MGARRGRLLAERMDVGHHVVPEALLERRGAGEIGVVEVRAHFGKRRVGNR